MTKLCNTVVVLIAAVLLIFVPAEAQTTQATATGNPPFAQLDHMLSGTADDLIANASQAARAVLPPQTAQPAAEHVSSQAGRLGTAVERVRQLRPLIEPILREEGVPTELTAVVLVESGGHSTALSPKGARGLWQLMPDTARRYGLVVTPERDERLDVLKSTHAAAHYLRDLYAQFGNWSAALAAYNAGEQVVGAALKRAGASDFQVMSRSLPSETRSYVPAVLAAMQWFGALSREARQGAAPGKILFAEFASGE